MNKVKKQEWVSGFRANVVGAKSILVANFDRITVKELEGIRNIARDKGVSVKVIVNNLAKIAFKDTPFSSLGDFVKNQSIILVSHDCEVACAALFNKVGDFEGRLVLRCVGLENEVLNTAEAKSLGSLPDLNVLRGKIASIINANIARVPTVIQAVSSALVRVIDAKVKKV